MSLATFNFFRVLEKDNKELIHSAFLKYLMQFDNSFYARFLNISGDFGEPKLEKLYKLSKKIGGRFDIEALGGDNRSVVIIENKFKAFPYVEQFQLYDKILKKYHDDKTVSRYLICFDKSIVGNYPDWIIKDYRDLLSFISSNYILDAQDDNSVFIRHYYDMLNNYFQEYKRLESNFRELFSDLHKDVNKFWLKLFYSSLKIRLEKYFNENSIIVSVHISTGNTTIPLINIVPGNWSVKGIDLLIQMQGHDIKFYSHTGDNGFLVEILMTVRPHFDNKGYEFKKPSNRKSKTQFILKAKVLDEITSEITTDSLFHLILKFYQEINYAMLNKQDKIPV